MSKGNLFLGYGRGKVGDIVLSRDGGEQVARARNRNPRNPRTAQQLMQRAVIKTCSDAYSYLRPICDHAFEGREGAALNQQEFMRRNADMLRSRAMADYDGVENISEYLHKSAAYNFAAKGVNGVCLVNPYVVSQGSVPGVTVGTDLLQLASAAGEAGDTMRGALSVTPVKSVTFGNNNDRPTLTWSQVCNIFGCKRGDEITLVSLVGEFTANGNVIGPSAIYPVFARLIVPVTPDTDRNDIAFEASNVTGGAFGSKGASGVFFYTGPTAYSEGNIQFMRIGTTGAVASGMTFACGGVSSVVGLRQIVAQAVIISRRGDNGKWLRSTASLTTQAVNTATIYDGLRAATLSTAIESFEKEAARSSKYLNQAQ